MMKFNMNFFFYDLYYLYLIIKTVKNSNRYLILFFYIKLLVGHCTENEGTARVNE